MTNKNIRLFKQCQEGQITIGENLTDLVLQVCVLGLRDHAGNHHVLPRVLHQHRDHHLLSAHLHRTPQRVHIRPSFELANSELFRADSVHLYPVDRAVTAVFRHQLYRVDVRRQSAADHALVLDASSFDPLHRGQAGPERIPKDHEGGET